MSKRKRMTKADVEQLENQIYAVLQADHPQSVRHVFYRMTDPRPATYGWFFLLWFFVITCEIRDTARVNVGAWVRLTRNFNSGTLAGFLAGGASSGGVGCWW